jgi:hypothetical protein
MSTNHVNNMQHALPLIKLKQTFCLIPFSYRFFFFFFSLSMTTTSPPLQLAILPMSPATLDSEWFTRETPSSFLLFSFHFLTSVFPDVLQSVCLCTRPRAAPHESSAPHFVGGCETSAAHFTPQLPASVATATLLYCSRTAAAGAL